MQLFFEKFPTHIIIILMEIIKIDTIPQRFSFKKDIYFKYYQLGNGYIHQNSIIRGNNTNHNNRILVIVPHIAEY